MLAAQRSQADVETEFHVVSMMVFSILQVSRGREKLLTASVRHFTLCGISDFYSNHWLYRPAVRKVIVLKQ